MTVHASGRTMLNPWSAPASPSTAMRPWSFAAGRARSLLMAGAEYLFVLIAAHTRHQHRRDRDLPAGR